MIKFFRKIRYDLMETGKTGKYFKYAIGEIILVMVGILLALQVNNANEQKNENNQLQLMLEKIASNIEQDLVLAKTNETKKLSLKKGQLCPAC